MSKSPSPNDPVNFDYASATRIANAVKTVEGDSTSLVGSRQARPDPQQETLWAKLGANVTPQMGTTAGKWEWQEVRRTTAETWQVVTDGRKGSAGADIPNLALEFPPYVAKTGDVVLLRRCNTTDQGNPAKWTPGWAIVEYSFRLDVGTECSSLNKFGVPVNNNNDTQDIRAIDFHYDDFILSQPVNLKAKPPTADMQRMYVQTKGFTVIGYGDNLNFCGTKIVYFSQVQPPPPTGSTTLVNYSAEGLQELPVVFTITGKQDQDTCATCYDPTTKPKVTITGSVFAPPAPPPCIKFNDCANTFVGKSETISVGNGLLLQMLGGSDCTTNFARIGINIGFTSNDGSVVITSSTSGCELIWDLSVVPSSTTKFAVYDCTGTLVGNAFNTIKVAGGLTATNLGGGIVMIEADAVTGDGTTTQNAISSCSNVISVIPGVFATPADVSTATSTATSTAEGYTDAAIAALAACSIAYSPGNAGDWAGSPSTVCEALDRLASAVAALRAGPIP